MKIDRPPSNQPLPPHAKKVFQGKLFSVYQWEQQLYDGSKATFEKLTRPDTVGVIAVTENKKILITHQEQPGIKPFIGIPGGIMDMHEEPLVSIKRELLEETGYSSKEWEFFASLQPYTRMDWAIFTFIAKNCHRGKEPHLDAGEKIEVQEVSFNEFIQLAQQPNFRDTHLALTIFRILTTPGELDKFQQFLLS